ncbi:MAG TPA: efflux RND transporter periplasmic adaptor subunit, partial [Bacteroidia bacterium]|nr:efflux RND transporter periplasmic adaptor subunit [Bacteroidia bacterium]
MKKVFIYGGTLIVALALIVWKLNANKKSDAARIEVVRESSSGAVPVQILAVKSSNVDLSFDENGNFEAVNQIELTAEIAGRVSELYVKEGSVVKAGQAIAKIENEILNANQTEAKARLEQLRLNLNRYEQAYKTGGVTQKQVDDARLELESAQAKNVQANKNLYNSVVKAPVNGIINTRYVEVGTYLASGNKIVEIVDDAKLKLTVNVNEYQIIQLHTGDKVEVTASVYPEVTYQGVITFIAAKSDASLNYPVEVEINNIAGKALKAGMYGTAHFKPEIKNASLMI